MTKKRKKPVRVFSCSCSNVSYFPSQQILQIKFRGTKWRSGVNFIVEMRKPKGASRIWTRAAFSVLLTAKQGGLRRPSNGGSGGSKQHKEQKHEIANERAQMEAQIWAQTEEQGRVVNRSGVANAVSCGTTVMATNIRKQQWLWMNVEEDEVSGTLGWVSF